MPPRPKPKTAVRPAPAVTPADSADLLQRIADALERLAPPRAPDWDEMAADAFVWHAEPAPGWLEAVPRINAVTIDLLQGVERVRDILLDNTRRFAKGLPANNALLWGARGMGKSSLVKAVIGAINVKKAHALALVEIHREDIPSLPQLLKLLRASQRRWVLFCDDLSFDAEDQHYKSLKAVLDGGIEGRPDNVILYATSNRRHLLPRDMMENERSTAINPHEAVEEKVSLSDRFGLWLGFHSCSQEDFFAMLDGYCAAYGLKIDQKQLRAEAVEWSMTRGARSGRVAWQFIQDLAGRLGTPLKAK
ncbi:ATP-binding protein [Ferrovibrio xuzhouensis]|uniref:ATP-binding protein n=1 Tax=Ferrovibrio xuzhouensis TaxID=1576914 RepID=A0ABV7VJ66_9PROT